MVGKVRVHEATVENVSYSSKQKKCYAIRINFKYANIENNYIITVYEGTKGMKAVKKFLNVDNLEKLKGKKILYLPANDIKEPSKNDVWMLANKDRTLFLDLKTYEVKTKQQVKKEISKFVFSEF